MTRKKLYNIDIPSDSQTNATLQGLGHEIESLSGLDTDVPAVETLGTQSGDQSIDASFANQRARVTAAELEELLSANGFDKLPYYTPESPGRQGDGYIAVEGGSVETASVHEDRVQVVSATFTRSGGRGDSRRTLSVNPAEIPDADERNDFGNVDECLVAIPTTAGKRTWFNTETKAREPVVVESSVEAEGGQLDLVDAYAVGLPGKMELVHDAGYDEHRVGVILWDDREYDDRDGLDGGDLAWQRCYKTSHEFSGSPVVDTGRLRLSLDTTGGLTAETFDSSTASWTATSLGASDWTLHDVDVTTISPVKVEAQVVFRDPSQSPPGEFALNLIARRGREVAHWLVPASVSEPTPQGLRDRLDPVADEAIVRGQESLGLIDRSEVRR